LSRIQFFLVSFLCEKGEKILLTSKNSSDKFKKIQFPYLKKKKLIQKYSINYINDMGEVRIVI